MKTDTLVVITNGGLLPEITRKVGRIIAAYGQDATGTISYRVRLNESGRMVVVPACWLRVI